MLPLLIITGLIGIYAILLLCFLLGFCPIIGLYMRRGLSISRMGLGMGRFRMLFGRLILLMDRFLGRGRRLEGIRVMLCLILRCWGLLLRWLTIRGMICLV